MDKKQRVLWAVRCILTVLLIGFILWAWPGYLAHDYFVSRTFSERYEHTDILPSQSVMTQYFVPQRSHMCGIEFAIIFNEAKVEDETARFVLCEGSGREILSREIPLKRMGSGFYYEIEVNKRLNAGETYYWELIYPDADDIGFQVMYTNHLADQAPENTLFLLNDEQYGDITQTISQYKYLVHPDKIIIICNYWMTTVLVYVICMDIVSRFSGPKQVKKPVCATGDSMTESM